MGIGCDIGGSMSFGILLLASALVAGSCVAEGPAGSVGPGEEGLLEVNGTELFVRRTGGGEPILVIHGGPVLDHGYMVPGLEDLAGEYELVFFDQRLSGRSAGSVDPASVRMEVFVEDMEAIRSALGLGPVHLLAHSWGGHLALRYALAHPDAVRTLVLVSPMAASSDLRQTEEEALAAAMDSTFRAELMRMRSAPAVAAGDPDAVEDLLRFSFRHQFVDPSLAEELEFRIGPDYTERSRQFGLLMPELTNFDLLPALESLEIPALILFGATEPGAELGGAALQEVLPGSELVRLEGAGHFAFLERSERFRDHVIRFLRQQGS